MANTAYLIQDEIVQFLKRVPPFQFLDDNALNSIVHDLSQEYYPKGMVILQQGGEASDSLRIIRKGGVRVSVRSSDGVDAVIDYRGEGDNFGLVSLMSKDRQKTTIVAVDDTVCYLLNRDAVYRMLDSHPVVTEYLLQSHFSKYIEKTYTEMRGKSLFYGSSDHLLFTTPVGALATTEVVTIAASAAIQDAALEMVRHRISSLIVTDENGLPAGIVTDRDLREKVVARGRDVSDPVRDIMSLPLVRVDARDHCFDAVIKMIKFNIHHIVVVEDGRLKGVLTNHDLMMLQGTSPLSLTKDIEKQQAFEGLIPVSRRINNIAGLLLKEGAKAGNITRVITEINDRLVRRVVEFAERSTGKPPLPYCWISFGSEGRMEQTFKTDQDNAIIHADPATGAEAAAAKAYFGALAGTVRDNLMQCGFPSCRANYMASNPQWCQPLSVWKKYFATWIDSPTPDSMLNSVIFFDFRPLYGTEALADSLRDALATMLKEQKVFLGYLANMAIRNAPPVGFLRSFVVEKNGEHKDQLNLKVKGLAPIVDLVRLFSLEKGIRETSTLDRIAALRGVHTIVGEYADELLHAFEFIMLLRIHRQYEQITSGMEPDNFIDPKQLSNLEKRSLKEAFRLISTLQDMVIERYKSLIW